MPAFRKYFFYLTIFVSGAVVLAIEIAGTRILAPFYGSTIFVWSALITVTLAALASGYYCGGRWGDRKPEGKWFYVPMLLGGAPIITILKLNQVILVWADQFGIRGGPLLSALLLFFFPLFFLSMIGPFAIRLLARDVEKAGTGAGIVLALSTAGSLVGALVTGFYLSPNFLVGTIFISLSIVTLFVGITGILLEKVPAKTAGIFIGAFLLFNFLPSYKYAENIPLFITHREAGLYSDLKVVDLPRAKLLVMDGGVHTAIDPKTGKSLFEYNYEIAKLLSSQHGNGDLLVLGFGAGGVSGALNKDIAVDYIDIEPKTFSLARQYFGYVKDENDSNIVADARWYLRHSEKKYDAILVDLFKGSASIPTHLYTKEAFMLLKERLKDGGVVYAHVVGDPEGLLVQSIMKTYAEVFPHVAIAGTTGTGGANSAIILAASSKDFSGSYKNINKGELEGKVLLDGKNNADLLIMDHVRDFRSFTNEVLGYAPLFSI